MNSIHHWKSINFESNVIKELSANLKISSFCLCISQTVLSIYIFKLCCPWDSAAGFQTADLQHRPQTAGQQGAGQTEALSGMDVVFL